MHDSFSGPLELSSYTQVDQINLRLVDGTYQGNWTQGKAEVHVMRGLQNNQFVVCRFKDGLPQPYGFMTKEHGEYCAKVDGIRDVFHFEPNKEIGADGGTLTKFIVPDETAHADLKSLADYS